MRLVLSLLLLSRLARSQGWGVWPLYTPLLGDISPQCKAASEEYITSYNSAVQSLARGKTLTKKEKEALAMFDSNGETLPFLQEGRLADTQALDLCDLLAPEPEANEGCKSAAPGVVRTVRVPFGYSTVPGTETQCRRAEAKYCYNYFQAFPPLSSQSTNLSLSLPLPVSQGPQLTTSLPLVPLQDWQDTGLDPHTANTFLTEMMDRSSRLRSLQAQISTFLQLTGLDEETGRARQSVVLQVVGLLIFVWGSINRDTGIGEWGKQAPLPYRGMCYPQACSKLDIQTSNLELYKYFAIPGLPMASSSPLISDYLAELAGLDEETKEEYRVTAVGCTDDYGGDWRVESYVMVTVLVVIALLTLAGTGADIYQAHPYIDKPLQDQTKRGLGTEIIRSFSLVQNVKFIFQTPAGSSARLSCLEGLRSLSMFWVILGHHFAFGFRYSHSRNWTYIYNVLGQHGGGVLLEAVMQGDFAVDTFMFIGATLASFLLMKDLDKSKGWFHRKGLVRLVLFYVNRYLRLTIPYALVMGVYIGIFPLIITDPIGAAQWANMEAKVCRETVGWHLTYSNIFYLHSNMCIGQTWYLSCEMICFFLSPLLIYPLWAGHSSLRTRLAALLWWSTVLASLLGLSVWYFLNPDLYDQHAALPGQLPQLPPFQYSPWGPRGQSYLIGIMAGYILYATKDNKVVIDRKLNIIMWEVMAFTGLALVYGPYWMNGDFQFSNTYNILHKVAWSSVLTWVTFSCSRGFGGVVNHLLSWGFWLPISKISFMTYMLHMSLNWYFFLDQTYNMDYTMWQVTLWFVPQLWISLLAGLLGCLTLELPFGRIQKLIIQKALDGIK